MSKSKQISQKGIVKRVVLNAMHVQSRHAQREKLNEARVDYLVANFDFEKFGLPTLSERDGQFYIIDGQHRIEALKRFLGKGWESRQINCVVYTGLSEADEAEKFLSLNNTLAVNAFDKFTVAVVAGRPEETVVNDVVKAASLRVTRERIPGAICAVSALMGVYRLADADTLARTLRIVRDAYGDAGMEARVINGIGRLCHRYNGILDEKLAVRGLEQTRGGVNGLLGKAEVLHKQVGSSKAVCVAAAAVDIINGYARHNGGRKLPSWWKTEDAS